MDLRTTPEEIELRSEDGTFRLRWADGHMTVYRNKDLRMLCRCASCVDENTGRPLLDAKSVPDSIQVEEADEVGNYGLKLRWTGGHDTGIYTWERLRTLDPSTHGHGLTPHEHGEGGCHESHAP